MSTTLSQKLLTLAVLLSIVGLNVPTATAEDPFWPCFHGAAGDNISTDTGLLSQWPTDGPELVWTAKGLGVGYASVSLAHGLIYTAGNIDENTVVMALDLDGNMVWQTPCGKAWTSSHEGTRSTPTIDGEQLYYETPLGDLVCLDAKKGEKIWELNILNEFVAKTSAGRWPNPC